MVGSRSVEFFDVQFQRQVAAKEFALNPFEARALPFVSGSVLDLGCGLGNLAVAAAAKGAYVSALDASPAGIKSLASRAAELELQIATRCVDLTDYVPEEQYDCVVAIGLFMFLPCDAAKRQLRRALEAVRPGGIAFVNVLVKGTSYMEMFDVNGGYCLLEEDELPRALKGWEMLDDRVETFDAPRGTIKRFRTSIARRPISN